MCGMREFVLACVLVSACGGQEEPVPRRPGCASPNLIWPENARRIPVCWEASAVVDETGARCACADGFVSEAPCFAQLCDRVCAGRGSARTCSPVPVPAPLVCDPVRMSEPDCNRLREVVRTAVEATWEAYSSVRFTGWGICSGPPEVPEQTLCRGRLSDSLTGIRIAVRDERPVACRGTSIDGMGAGMRLNFRWSEDEIRTTAVHEFGHALGFEHEQYREDAPEWCDEEDARAGCGAVFGEWDASSVMNYCNPEWAGGGVLSAVDIEMVRSYYPPGEPAPSCVGGLSMCGTSCIDVTSDARHCGTCDNGCAANHACVTGVCRSCDCGIRCDVSTPCGNRCVCSANQICATNVCDECGSHGEPCCDARACEAGLRCDASSQCVPACGRLDESCCPGRVCDDGRCVAGRCAAQPSCEDDCQRRLESCSSYCEQTSEHGCIERCQRANAGCLSQCP
jgi:hypothetical protein